MNAFSLTSMHHLSTSGVVFLSNTFTGTVLVADWERNHLMCTKSCVQFEKMVFKCKNCTKSLLDLAFLHLKPHVERKAE